MDKSNDIFKDCRVSRGIDTMTEIENMAGMPRIIFDDALRSRQGRLCTRQDEGRVKIALNDKRRTHACAGRRN